MRHDVTHDDAFRHLDDFVDGELEPDLHAAVDRHVQGCTRCTAEVAAIRGLVQRAHALPESIEPRRNLWLDIESSIRSGGASAASPHPAPQRAGANPRQAARHPWFGRLQPPAWRWAYALGSAAIVVTITVAVWQTQRGPDSLPSSNTGSRAGDTDSEAAVSSTAGDVVRSTLSALELECMGAGKLLVASMEGWPDPANAELTASIAAGLDDVNLAIAETRAALGADPQDAELLRLLTARYEQKLALLHGAMRLIEEA